MSEGVGIVKGGQIRIVLGASDDDFSADIYLDDGSGEKLVHDFALPSAEALASAIGEAVEIAAFIKFAKLNPELAKANRRGFEASNADEGEDG